MALDYLDFDYSEDEAGWGNFDAIASVREPHLQALQSELAHLLRWAHTAFPHQQAPLDEGGEWDYDLQTFLDNSVKDAQRHVVNLSISGTAAFCDALKHQFDLE